MNQVLKFKTTLSCNGCKTKVGQFLNEADFPTIHMGLHFGKILIRDGKYFV